MASRSEIRTAMDRRRRRVRAKVFGTAKRPRLSVYRSLDHMHAQLIDDVSGTTLVSASTLEGELRKQISSGGNREAAAAVGKLIAQRALEKGYKEVVFDRGGRLYHGRVAALADGAREAGLQF